MRLRTKFLLVIIILHVVALVLTFYIFDANRTLFMVCEAAILISIIISWQLYQQMLKPLQTVVDGIEAIKDKDFNVKFLRTGTYEMDQLVDVYNEMMEHLKVERTRQEQQHFFLEKLIHTSPTGIVILDFDEKVQQVNPKGCTIIGLTQGELLGRSLSEVNKPLMRELGVLRSGEAKTISLDGVHTYKLQRSHFIDRGFARSFLMIEELTAEILAAEKNAYGKVIRMMAHEVNNTIGPVNSILDSALQTSSLWTEDHETLKYALNVAFERNRSLNIFMRNFADVVRLPLPNKTEVDLTLLLTRVVSLFEFKAKDAGIRFVFPLPGQYFHLHADAQQMEQALINIVKNAMEAIEGGGEIIITLDPVASKLSISDTGAGISNEHAAQLFTPFFSTKRDGQGVGLTLVREILLNHEYVFSLKSGAPAGAVFEIEFNPSV